MHDFGAVRPSDRHRAAPFAGIDLDDVRPPYPLVSPCPEFLLKSPRIDEDGTRKRGKERDGY